MDEETMTAEVEENEEIEVAEIDFDPTMEFGEVDQSDLQSLASMGF